MQGSRCFATARVSVWTSATRLAGHPRAAAGLSLNLAPRDPLLPSLRADAHYFQIGPLGRVSWWFAGTADLAAGPDAPAEAFERHVSSFLSEWERLRLRHRRTRRQEQQAFLDGCLLDDSTSGGPDRGSAFAFMTEVVDALLPAYLPLLVGASPGVGNTDDGSKFIFDSAFGEEHVDRFCIEGGARCESRVARGGPLGSWRFSIAPSGLTAAGKAYVTLRNDHRCGRVPILYI